MTDERQAAIDVRQSGRARWIGRVAWFVLAAAVGWLAATGVHAQEGDLPGRVGRVADVAGELFLAPQDQPEQWNAIGLNYPVAAGDNVWVGADGRAEIDIGAGQFRLAANTSLLLSRLDDRQFALFIAQGRVSLRVRVLDPGETAQIDTPNAQLVLTRPGLYRVDVTEDRQRTELTVREGEATVQTGDQVAQVLPGQSATAEGEQPALASVVNGLRTDELDAWVASRERYYDRSRTNSYVSRQMVGWADLEEYGTWEQRPEYGAVWYPSGVAADWAPYRDGYWTEVGAWGPTWVDHAPWGYAPFHYGRWAYIGGRWGWCPGAYVPRPTWAPALVAWTGGPGWAASVSSGGAVYGWVPLAWGEAYRPWWRRCSQGCWERYNRPYSVDLTRRPGRDALPPRYANLGAPGGLSAVAGTGLLIRKPVRANLVDVGQGMRTTAPILADAPRIVAEPGIPGRAPGRGTPPPASTFYPTLARPGVSGGGVATALPAGAADTRVMPPRTTSGAPMGMSRPAPVLAGPNGSPATRSGDALVRPAPNLPAERASIGNTSSVGSAPSARPAPAVATPGAGYAPVPNPDLSRQANRPQGVPLPPSLGATAPAPSPPPALIRQAPPPASQARPAPPPQYPLSRPALVAPQMAPIAPQMAPVAPAPMPRAAQVAPPAPAPAPAPAPPPAPGDGQVRSRPAAPSAVVPVPERTR